MTEEGLSPTRAKRIADAVEDIERNVSRLQTLQSLSKAEYCAPENVDRRDAVERKFEKLSAATVDIAETILKAERGVAPEQRKEKIRALVSAGIIDHELAQKLCTAVGFRDVLAHTYGPVVNDELVYDALQTGLGRYVEFVKAVDEYLQKEA